MRNSISLLFFCLLLHSSSVQSRDQVVTTMEENVPTKPVATIPYDLDWDLKIDGDRTSERIAPALYVFGDSLVDAGNNNLLRTKAKANFLPYGVDFLGIPTGRFTNGKTMADVLGRKLGLPYPPPYLGLLDSQRKNVTTGVNYGSGSCGILPETGRTEGYCLSLNQQILFFESTVKNDLPTHFNSRKKLSDYLSKSIFFVAVGAADYFINYLHPNVTSNKIYTNETFAKHLTDELAKRIQRLYQLGARKFLVNDLGKAGCVPAARNTIKHTGFCVEWLNKLSSLYDAQFSVMIQNLQTRLPGSIFVRMNSFKIFHEVIEMNPRKYGITDTKNPCCGAGTSPCPPNAEVVGHRDQHIYFDSTHPTQAANEAIIALCFNESSFCSPMNIQQLVKA